MNVGRGRQGLLSSWGPARLTFFNMKIYHFTARKFLREIQKEGLTKGGTPIIKRDSKVVMFRNTQWLTIDKKWEQAFHNPEETTLEYDRREIRLTIVIPASKRIHLADKKRIINVFGATLLPGFFDHPDCENWRIFYGRVKAQWIRKVDINPKFENVAIK